MQVEENPPQKIKAGLEEKMIRIYLARKKMRTYFLQGDPPPPMVCSITLCGIKHAGKSAVSRELARFTGLTAFDTDDFLRLAFEQESGKSLTVREIYKLLGEEAFRQKEAAVIRELTQRHPLGIFALGGGALSNPFFTAEDRKKLGFICCLDVPDEVAYRRVAREGLPPFLQGEKDPFGAFCRMNDARREVFRREAHACIVPDVFERLASDVAQHVLEVYKEKFYE